MAHRVHMMHGEHGHMEQGNGGGYIQLSAQASQRVEHAQSSSQAHEPLTATQLERHVRMQVPDGHEEAAASRLRQRRSTALDSEGEPLLPKQGDSDSDAGGPREDLIPLLGDEKVIVDDSDSSYVMIFPRSKQHYGGTVDEKKMRATPKEDWERIFGTHQEARRNDRCPPELKRGAVPESEYQALVREKILDICRESGLVAHTVPSIDDDEVFLKIALPVKGHMFHKLAQTFQYQVPFKDECYKEEKAFGTYPGGRPMLTADGDPAPAYKEFTEDLMDKFRPFRHIDEVRLIIKHLASCMNLAEMVNQNVLSRHFPGANHFFVTKLNRDWAGFHNIFTIPDTASDENIRSYFGEEVAFFFRWFALYTRSLGVLAVFGLITAVRYVAGFTLTQQDRILVWFGVGMIIWETVTHKVSKADMSRAVQVWGMRRTEITEDDLPHYQASLEGTPELAMRRGLTTFVVIFYVMMTISLITSMNFWFSKLKVAGTNIQSLQPYVQTFIVKFLSWMWRKIAYHLVLWQNHRTQTRFNNALIKYLSIVKLFVALFPFAYLAFLEPVKGQTCAASLSEAAHQVYKNQGWPEGTTVGRNPGGHQIIPDDELKFLKGFWYNRGNQSCISGCYPIFCMDENTNNRIDGPPMQCTSSCMVGLQSSLRTLYFTHIGLTAFYLIVPVITTRFVVFNEMRKARQKYGKKVTYTFLQFQAKCHLTAPYHFTSWGGSFVEDFLELVVSYALLACFGICYPLMSCIGFVSLIVEYRLLAYRMTNVTCRPKPRGTQGIGTFESVLTVVSLCALTFNVGIVVFLMLPYRNLPVGKQLACFVVAEKGAFLLRSVISFFVPGDPEDVRVIQDFNNSVKSHLAYKDLCSDEKFDYSGIDIGLAHKPVHEPPGVHADTEGGSEDEGEEEEEKTESDEGGGLFC